MTILKYMYIKVNVSKKQWQRGKNDYLNLLNKQKMHRPMAQCFDNTEKYTLHSPSQCQSRCEVQIVIYRRIGSQGEL